MRFMRNSDVRVLYMGTPEMSANVLRGLIEAGFSVVGVVSQADKEVGRKRVLEPAPTKKVALEHGIPSFTPAKIRLDYAFAESLSFDVIVTMAYGQIIPEGLLRLAKVGPVNLHGSLLPELRGAAPIQRAIMQGKTVTGVTLMEMTAAMDAGVMYDKEEVAIDPEDNYTTLSKKISDAARSLILKDLLKYANGELIGEKQDRSLVTIANKIRPEDEKLPLNLSSKDAINYIRALSDEPGAFAMLGDKKFKIYKASMGPEEISSPLGTLRAIKGDLYLQLMDGLIRLDEIQLEGKKRMDARSFLNGAHLEEGARLK
jgi:methionyl-tRNA formyltransferase